MQYLEGRPRRGVLTAGRPETPKPGDPLCNGNAKIADRARPYNRIGEFLRSCLVSDVYNSSNRYIFKVNAEALDPDPVNAA